ncbi:cell shape determination protein CcmA [Endozoicomonas sp. OPT23]|uniref:bactofilin family protein n=1 Tax=Endozoicomonas sp. OPT23 TaxID=2072845 RepID=UPI00129AE789|nr:polymer-forming cytoskeletal protein [Endozoicomonas sp. OPT23]MRI32946.1 cell shape determination protein CcmA [Endozoicomonas sp. OPT23]
MFGSKNSDSSSSSNAQHNNAITLIAAGTEVEGDIRFRGTVHVEGGIKGNVSSSDGKLQLIDGSSVDGNIRAAHVIINGHVIGDVYATEKLELSAKALVEGNVYYDVMEMVAGAAINGKMERMHKSGELLPKDEDKKAEVKKLKSA